jgi:hypothetical protein
MSSQRHPHAPRRHSSAVSADPGSCPACGGDRLTEIAMTLTDGSPVRFRSCRKCEAKSWDQGGDDLSLIAVMDKSRKLGS